MGIGVGRAIFRYWGVGRLRESGALFSHCPGEFAGVFVTFPAGGFFSKVWFCTGRCVGADIVVSDVGR